MDNKQRKRIKDGIYTGRGERNNILEKCNNHNPENVDKWSVHCPLTSTYFDYVVLYCDTREECIDTALRECIPK
jgi:hypothetical protein